ncbi:MAG: lamin tail domain-containing protein [Chloroflexota bacterium]
MIRAGSVRVLAILGTLAVAVLAPATPTASACFPCTPTPNPIPTATVPPPNGTPTPVPISAPLTPTPAATATTAATAPAANVTFVPAGPPPTNGASSAPVTAAPTTSPAGVAVSTNGTNSPPPSGVAPAAPPLSPILINELVTNPRNVNWDGGGVPVQAQWVELFNPSPAAVDLAGWRLSAGSQVIVLPAGTSLAGHAHLVLFKRQTGLNFASGAIALTNESGGPSDEVTPPPLPADQSYARIPDGSSNWTIDATPTLGSANVLAPPAATGAQATISAIKTALAGRRPASGTARARLRRHARSRTRATFQELAITAIRALPDGRTVQTSGVVTMPSDRFERGRGYIEDGTSGLLIHVASGSPTIRLGDSLSIRGTVRHYRGEVELAGARGGARVLGPGADLSPQPISPGSVGQSTEGLLVQVSGTVSARRRDYLTVSGADGAARLYLYPSLGFPAGGLAIGEDISAVGVVNAYIPSQGAAGSAQRTAAHRVVPRLTIDIRLGSGGAEVASPSVVGVRRSGTTQRRGTLRRIGPSTENQAILASNSVAGTPSPFITPVYGAEAASIGGRATPVIASAGQSAGPKPPSRGTHLAQIAAALAVAAGAAACGWLLGRRGRGGKL